MEANGTSVERRGPARAVVVLDRVHMGHLKRTVVVEERRLSLSAVDRWRGRRRHVVVHLARGAAYRSKAAMAAWAKRNNREDKQLRKECSCCCQECATMAAASVIVVVRDARQNY